MDELWEAVNRRNEAQHFQEGLFVWDIPTFNEAAIREAILNAVAHRDYRLGGSVFVRQYPQGAVAKVRRLRNQVAHLRNVGFQDMEDLTRTLERMRRDVIDYGGWKVPAAADAPELAVPQEAK